MQKKILVLNDLHVGSAYALLPPDFMDTEGNIHVQNVGQKFLWDIFTKTLVRLQPQKIDTIVINGDLLDGAPGKAPNKSQDSTLHRVEDQIEAAVKVLEEIKNRLPKAEWYFVRGTPNHEFPADVAHVASRLLGKTYPIYNSLPLRTGKAVVNFSHEVSFTSALTKAAPLEREMIYQWLSEGMNGHKVIHCEVRAHCHYFAYVGRRDRLAIVCPCWQLQTPYMTRNSPKKNIPDLGCIVLSVDDSYVDYGMCPVSFTEYLYLPPETDFIDIANGGQDGEDIPVVTL